MSFARLRTPGCEPRRHERLGRHGVGACRGPDGCLANDSRAWWRTPNIASSRDRARSRSTAGCAKVLRLGAPNPLTRRPAQRDRRDRLQPRPRARPGPARCSPNACGSDPRAHLRIDLLERVPRPSRRLRRAVSMPPSCASLTSLRSLSGIACRWIALRQFRQRIRDARRHVGAVSADGVGCVGHGARVRHRGAMRPLRRRTAVHLREVPASRRRPSARTAIARAPSPGARRSRSPPTSPVLRTEPPSGDPRRAAVARPPEPWRALAGTTPDTNPASPYRRVSPSPVRRPGNYGDDRG